jgi:nitrogen fixation-related uncharacterized protein
MPRKYITIIGIVILCAVIVASFLYLHKNQQFEEANPANSIPSNSAIVIQVHKPSQLKNALFNSPDYIEDVALFEK